MIGKAKSISHISNAVNYAKNKKGALEINRHNVAGETGTEIAQEFRVFQNLNARCERNSFSIVLSPAIPDGQKLTNGDFVQLANDFLLKMNLKENQHITFLHSDKNHKHLHIFVNRIDFNGKAYKDNYISKKAQRIAESIAKDWKFTTAKEVQQQKEDLLSRQVIDAHEKALQQKPRNIFEYAELMKPYGINTQLKQASDGKVVGIKFLINENSIKASSVHRSFSAANLQKLILQSLQAYNTHKRNQQYNSNKKQRFRL
ncbi:relaxase/mobilization nuclease domain-containing protein [Maribellus comscasis]|uniref:Relaxase/mobilization nuclease domain-containing protein n=1 Tax=Maribellus comscasis TaxID=2681766 RepID=A0A6I6K6I6_9BACT|nr:relaxase/mobilization nuclease domain-containing protein [Maribellus comscasis]QGY47273.1 relaxase/mobilization nuclease domain-containing protein [Maribellus comscasis]